jgi:hypothetical protein
VKCSRAESAVDTTRHYLLTSDTTERERENRLCKIVGSRAPFLTTGVLGLPPHVGTVIATGQADPRSLVDNQVTWANKNELNINKEETMAEMEQYKARRGCLECVVA